MGISNDDLYALDRFVGIVEGEFLGIENFAQYIRFHGGDEEKVAEGLDILRKKLKKMKKCESASELDEYVKVNKVLKSKEDLHL